MTAPSGTQAFLRLERLNPPLRNPGYTPEAMIYYYYYRRELFDLKLLFKSMYVPTFYDGLANIVTPVVPHVRLCSMCST